MSLGRTLVDDAAVKRTVEKLNKADIPFGRLSKPKIGKKKLFAAVPWRVSRCYISRHFLAQDQPLSTHNI